MVLRALQEEEYQEVEEVGDLEFGQVKNFEFFGEGEERQMENNEGEDEVSLCLLTW